MQLRALLLATLLVAFAAPALAQPPAAPGPAGAHATSVGNATLAWFVGPDAATMDEDLALGEPGSLWFLLAANATRVVVHLNVTPTSDTLAIENGSFTLEAGANLTTLPQNVTVFSRLADAGVVNMTYAFAGEVYEETNGTLALVGPISGSGAFTLDVGSFEAPVAPAPAIPRSWLIAGAVILLLGIVVGAYGARQRAVRRRMNEGPRRSQVMREMELERKLEKAKAPEQVAEIKQEIRQAETVREKRREVQILEAKRADALKTLDLLRKRHEAGGLTKLQYDNMAAKKQADLERIEAEIAAMEREGSGAAA